MIEDYLEHVAELFATIGTAVPPEATIRCSDPDAASLAASFVFSSTCVLHVVLEVMAVPGYFPWTYYSFQCQTPEGVCIFRYDMSAHHPEISETFPHHKHVGGEQRVVAAQQPTVHQIRHEVMRYLGILSAVD